MSFKPNKTPAEIINEGAFGGTYFRDIYSRVNGKWYKSIGKNLIFQKVLILNYIRVIIMMSMLISMV